MKTPLPVAVDAATYNKFNACVHCGLCLPACPTYVETTDEAHSPRGRIQLMKSVVDQKLPPSAAVLEHLDACLVCRACEPACPSGVAYHDLIEAVRPQVAVAAQGQAIKSPLLRFLVRHVFPFPLRTKWALIPVRLLQKVGLGSLAGRLPGTARLLGNSLPAGPLWPNPPIAATAVGEKRGTVLVLFGCVGSVLAPEVNVAAVEVLAHNGYDVVSLPDETCCGAMAAHANDPEQAMAFARKVVDRLHGRPEVAFISSIAGCSAQLKLLHHTLHNDAAYAEKAAAVVGKIRDVTEFLAEVGLRPPRGAVRRKVVYHDPCHLAHAQRVTAPPRQLLQQIPGLTLLPLNESDLCCGAAGTYNLTQPAMAETLGQRKARNILAGKASVCATANLGCQLQIQRHLAATGQHVPVLHVVQLLAQSYGSAPAK